jgi:ankyrin repeat protein
MSDCLQKSLIATVFIFAISCPAGAGEPAAVKPDAGAAQGRVDFAKEIAPILRQHCVDCHGPDLQMAALRLDGRQAAFDGGVSGSAIVAGQSQESRLVQRLVDRGEGILMPPTFPFLPGEKAGLPEDQIALIKRWIDQGAQWPDDVKLAADAEPSPAERRLAELHRAIRAGEAAAVARLLDDKSLVDAPDRHGNSPLHHAALYSDSEVVKLLLERGADVNQSNREGGTPLMFAASDADKVRLLLDKGAKIDARSKMGRTAFLVACAHANNIEAVRLLLKQGANVNDQDLFGETPLISASKRGDRALVQELISAGADVGTGRRPALYWAADQGDVETLALLLKQSTNLKQEALDATLVSAAIRGPVEAVRLLLERGANPNVPASFGGYTALMGAAYSENVPVEIVRLLLDKGADPKLQTKSGTTAIELARKHGRTKVVELLQQAGAEK